MEITEEAGFITCKANKINGTNIDLDFPSVGATENIILATVLSEGTTVINNAAMEPEIIDLVNYLKKMGAKIEGAGTMTITVKGVKKLSGASYNIMPDRIEAGTLLCAVAGTGGKVTLTDVNPNHLSSAINKLEECGCEIEVFNRSISLKAPKRLKPLEIKTMPYPGFPTDLQQPFTVLLTQCDGKSKVEETIYENRFMHIAYLNDLGADITVKNQTATVFGPTSLVGTKVVATDLRAGAAMVVAGLLAKGTTTITNIEHILRGYEQIVEKLISVGAKIENKEI